MKRQVEARPLTRRPFDPRGSRVAPAPAAILGFSGMLKVLNTDNAVNIAQDSETGTMRAERRIELHFASTGIISAIAALVLIRVLGQLWLWSGVELDNERPEK